MKTLPDEVKPFERTPEFDASSVPVGLLRGHHTSHGVWGAITVLQGRVIYRINSTPAEEVTLTPGVVGIIEPDVPHSVELLDGARFFVQFYKA
ncbi:DUF1971 domain-containing protein [Sinimarinibacterium sp. NLF-5-8]|uniref:DUF1971 domain-containing protein n=1 Tax=Sinimarinibacterium sp. NLF-5-8 TaxID=2698684 RepID=UPI00137C31CF|nr:DUF1971 domain-containing protein [Sinimarinibacterium sp. NLF-5-8]QHS08701.1 DUF1971 domain-containing protein [Sinimarinibacterium sp. NLF-5-8]